LDVSLDCGDDADACLGGNAEMAATQSAASDKTAWPLAMKRPVALSDFYRVCRRYPCSDEVEN
jgi:hypothetical protein